MTREEFQKRMAAIRAANPSASELYVRIQFSPMIISIFVVTNTATIQEGNMLIAFQDIKGRSREIPYGDIKSVSSYPEQK